MNKKQSITPQNLDGLFIYHDDRGRCIYSAPFMKDGYIIGRSNIKEYTLYNSRLMLSFVIAICIYVFFHVDLLTTVIIGVGLYVVSTIMFYTLFLPKLSKVRNFVKPKKDGFYASMAKNSSYITIIFFIVFLEAFAALVLINCFSNNYTGWLKVANIALAVAVSIFGLSCIKSLIIKKKQETK